MVHLGGFDLCDGAGVCMRARYFITPQNKFHRHNHTVIYSPTSGTARNKIPVQRNTTRCTLVNNIRCTLLLSISRSFFVKTKEPKDDKAREEGGGGAAAAGIRKHGRQEEGAGIRKHEGRSTRRRKQ